MLRCCERGAGYHGRPLVFDLRLFSRFGCFAGCYEQLENIMTRAGVLFSGGVLSCGVYGIDYITMCLRVYDIIGEEFPDICNQWDE